MLSLKAGVVDAACVEQAEDVGTSVSLGLEEGDKEAPPFHASESGAVSPTKESAFFMPPLVHGAPSFYFMKASAAASRGKTALDAIRAARRPSGAFRPRPAPFQPQAPPGQWLRLLFNRLSFAHAPSAPRQNGASRNTSKLVMDQEPQCVPALVTSKYNTMNVTDLYTLCVRDIDERRI